MNPYDFAADVATAAAQAIFRPHRKIIVEFSGGSGYQLHGYAESVPLSAESFGEAKTAADEWVFTNHGTVRSTVWQRQGDERFEALVVDL